MTDATALAQEVVAYLRQEADFNRSWTDGRLGPPKSTPGYIARRTELAEQRDNWAAAIDSLSQRLAAAERERDIARATCKMHARDCVVTERRNAELTQKLAAAERERDGYMASAELHYKIRCDQEQNSSNLADHLAAAERERDEARAEIDRLVLCYSDLMHSHDHWKSQATEQASSAERWNAELARGVAAMAPALMVAEECIANFIGMYGDSGAGLILRQIQSCLAPQEPPTS